MTWDDSTWADKAVEFGERLSRLEPVEDEDPGMPFATRVPRDYGNGTVKHHLVVVEATDAEDARRESGLTDFEFHPATDDELDEWERIAAKPLTAKDAEHLARLVRKQAREIGRRTRKRHADERVVYPGEMYRARMCMELVAKLEVIEDDADADEALREVGG